MTSAVLEHTDRVLAAVESGADGRAHKAVQNSWSRSANAYRIDPESRQAPRILTAREIRGRREPATQFLDIAQPELDQLYKLVRPTRYVVLLCDSTGVVIDHRGEETEAQKFKHWGTWLGGVWAEDIEGTNGIGTCIAEQRAITVHKSQHFRVRHVDLSCSGAPIFRPDGSLVGVLDVSSIDPNLSEHAHALTGALTIAAARAIEERMFREEFREKWVLALRIPEALGSAMLLAVDRDRRIVGAGRIARGVLAHLGHHLERGIAISAVFEQSHGLFRKQDQTDLWTCAQPVGSDELWPVIVTPPLSLSRRGMQSRIDDLRPRRDMFLSGHWKQQLTPPVRGGLSPSALRRVRDYVQQHVNESIELESLAAVAGLSMFHFARAFKQSEGMTPHDYVMECRLAKARNLLRGSALSLSEIALAVGFADQSHFTRRFRAAFGLSPGQFRKSADI